MDPKSGTVGLLLTRNRGAQYDQYKNRYRESLGDLETREDFARRVDLDLAERISGGWKTYWPNADLYLMTGECFGEGYESRALAVVLRGKPSKAALRHVVQRSDKGRSGYFISPRRSMVRSEWLIEELHPIVRSYRNSDSEVAFPALTYLSEKCGNVTTIKIGRVPGLTSTPE